MNASSYSLADLDALAKSDPQTMRFLDRQLADSYSKFVHFFYLDLDDIFARIEQNPQFYFQEPEDRTTYSIITSLLAIGYKAGHDVSAGGHVDIWVHGRQSQWSWIGEAKIFKSVADMRAGLEQLTTRYRNAGPNDRCGGLVGYLDRANAAAQCHAWYDHVCKLSLPELLTWSCLQRKQLAFFSRSLDEALGTSFTIRHMIVTRFFEPKDKSARTAKRRRDVS